MNCHQLTWSGSIAAFLFTLIAVLLAAGPGCIRSVTARPDVSDDGKPTLEVCAELMARANAGRAVASASPSGAPRVVATVAPSAAPAIPRVE